MSLHEWCDFMVPVLEQFGNLGRLDGENWQEWALQLLNLPRLSGTVVPDPFQFAEWSDWAERLNKNLWAMS
jgi:hypothetical protein